MLDEVRPHLTPALQERVEQVSVSLLKLAQDYRQERNAVQEDRARQEQELQHLRAQGQLLLQDRNHAQRERDLFRALLKSDEVPSVRTFLDQVLGALVSLTDAQKGIFLLFARPGEIRGKPIEVVTRGCSEDDIAVVWEQLELSQGIVRRALSTRAPVYTEEALRDSRFAEQASVRLLRLKTVLCAPLLNQEGKGLGVLYLENRTRSNAIPESDRVLIELVMDHVSRWVSRQMLVHLASESVDHTTQHRERYGFREIVGRSEALAEVLRLITLSLDLNSMAPVLITGEVGTGKELVARALHFNSRRARGPFVTVHCNRPGELPLEGQLFGFARGAFPSAERNQGGRVEEAHNGTLFLDQVESLSLQCQERLVALLRDGRVTRMGETTSRPVEVRVITASHADLRAAIAAGTFREDLFMRLDVFRIPIPPLRERRDDIPLLSEHSLLSIGQNIDRVFALNPDAFQWLQEQPLQGNVRELQTLLGRAAMQSSDGMISSALLGNVTQPPPPIKSHSGKSLPNWKEATATFQRQLLADTLGRTDRNLQEAADLLGISRQHLSRLMHELDLDAHRPAHRGRKPRRENGTR